MAPAFGLYTHIRANRIRSVLMLAGLFLLVYVIIYAGALIFRAMTEEASLDWYLRQAFTDMIAAWPFATLAALAWLAIAYRFNQWMIDKASGSHGVTRLEEPHLYNLLENLCISRGLPMPKLRIIDTPVLNAFASGLNQKQYAVTLTRGLVERLDDAEIEAVLAHELTHIRNGDVRLLVISLIIAGIVGFVAEMSFRMMFHAGGSARPRTWSMRTGSSSSGGGSRKGGGAAIIAIIVAIALIALAWFLSQVVRFSLSRSREYLADAGAVELTQNPDAMIMALRKIEGRGELPDTPSAVMEMCIDNPRSGLVDLFATHPSIDRRVEALVRFAGGRDPGPVALPMPETEALAGPDGAQAPMPGEAGFVAGDDGFTGGHGAPGAGNSGDGGSVGLAAPETPFLPAESPVAPPLPPGPWGPPSPPDTSSRR